MKTKLNVQIQNEEKKVFEGEADFVLAPGTLGEIGILPHHAKLCSTLSKGEIIIENDEKTDSIPVSQGMIEIKDNFVKVFTVS